jgi:drug/metabolite transporter (DMT)-like permease
MVTVDASRGPAVLELADFAPGEHAASTVVSGGTAAAAAAKGAHRLLGFAYMAASAMFFSVMSLMIHLLSARGFSSFSIVIIRGVSIALFAYATLFRLGISPLGPRDRRLRALLVVRSLVGTVALNAFTYAFSNMPLSDATCIVFLAPAVTAALAGVFLGERVGRFGWSMIAASFGGVLLIARPRWLFGAAAQPESVPVIFFFFFCGFFSP